jgi:outer membrane protein OmpA-like peptidoglycan-associated protein
MLSQATPSDAALGFKPSNAPALDPSISNWVSAPILAHYRQTASAADINTPSNAALPAVGRGKATGGPNMSGAVVANMDALSSTAAGAIAANYGGVPPTAIVYFRGDGTTLNAQGRAKVREAAAAFKAAGGAGVVRVVGHAASRTANMSVEKHLEVIFEKSQKRADMVAQELIHDGVPADKVNIQAVGDSQPIYYESMPKGEDGNRRAEIFLQS